MMRRVALVLALLLVPVAVMAQEEVPKAEVGVFYENLEVAHANSAFGNVNFDRKTSGVGFRVTYNINRWAGVETLFSYQPNVNVSEVGGIPSSTFFGGSNAELNIFHNEYQVKATARQGDHDQVGLFVYAGPGWVHIDPNAVLETVVGSTNKFTFSFGAGVEYYPTRRFGLRVDFGDLIAHLGTIGGIDQPTTNNLVIHAGGSFRW